MKIPQQKNGLFENAQQLGVCFVRRSGIFLLKLKAKGNGLLGAMMMHVKFRIQDEATQ
jgi:hypothetical protein